MAKSCWENHSGCAWKNWAANDCRTTTSSRNRRRHVVDAARSVRPAMHHAHPLSVEANPLQGGGETLHRCQAAQTARSIPGVLSALKRDPSLSPRVPRRDEMTSRSLRATVASASGLGRASERADEPAPPSGRLAVARHPAAARRQSRTQDTFAAKQGRDRTAQARRPATQPVGTIFGFPGK